MMADENQVLIEFGARIDKLVDATNQVRDRLQNLSSSADSLGAGFSRLGEIIVAAFSVERIVAFVESMADLGLQTERTAAMLGTSIDNVVQLGGVAQLTGTSMESLTMGIERLSLNVQRSTRDAFNPQAQALKVLGLNAKEMIGLDAPAYFDKLREAVSKFNPSLNLTNAVMAVGSRGIAQMMPMLILAGVTYREFEERVRAARDGLAAAIPGMAQTHVELTILSESMQGLGAKVFSALKPAIDGVIKSFQDFIANVKEMTKAGNALGGSFDFFILAARLAASAVAALTSGILAFGVAFEGVMKLAMGDVYDFEANAKKTADALETIGAGLKKRLAEIWSTPVPITIHAGGGADAGAINEGARMAIEAQRARYQAEIALLQENLAQKKILYDLDATLWRSTDNQKFASTMDATRQEFAAEQEKLKKIRDLWPAHSKEWEAEQLKMTQAVAKYGTEMVRLNAESIKSMETKFSDVFGQIQTSFNSSLRGLLNGTTTWAQAFKNILGDLVIYFIQAVEKMVFKWIAGQLAETVASQSAEGAKIAAATAGAAAALPEKIASFTSDIMASSARTFAGIFAFLAPFMGPAAAGPAAAGQATVLAELANVPKFEYGTDFVPYTGLAMVHRGERITPASQNTGPGGPSMGGGGDVHLHVNAIDGASVARFFKNNADLISRTLGNRRAVAPSAA